MKKLLLFMVIVLSLLTGIEGQPQKVKPIIVKDKKGNISFIQFPENLPLTEIPQSTDDFFKNFVRTSSSDHFKIKNKVNKGQENLEVFDQYFKGVKVENGGYIFHYKSGRLKYILGNFIRMTYINTIPRISPEQAKNIYAEFEKIPVSNISDYSDSLFIRVVQVSDSISSPRLVYRINLFGNIKNNFYAGIIDAQSGSVISKEPLYLNNSATGTFATRYNGSQQATTQNYGGYFHLKDSSRGAVIQTWNFDGYGRDDVPNRQYYRSEISDANNDWTVAEYHNNRNDMALDIHWALQEIWDYLFNTYRMNSFNNAGYQIESYFHFGVNDDERNNSFWHTGYNILGFGEGGSLCDAVGSLDAVSHEYAHGIADMTLYWESPIVSRGSLMEGLSDILAVILENRIRPDSIWKIGEQITLSNTCIRNIKNTNDPNAFEVMSSFYKDTQYQSASFYLDSCYIRSGVFSHWFYLLVNGGNGVTGIGMDEAEEFLMTAILNQDIQYATDYPDLRFYTILSASLNYGHCSNIAKQVRNAWHAVGVGDEWPSLEVTIAGDTEVPIYHNGFWDAAVDGGITTQNGTCNYSFVWKIDDAYIGNDQYLLNWFDGSIWGSWQPFEVDCQVYDGVTYAYANTFYSTTIGLDPLSVSISGSENVCEDQLENYFSDAQGGSEYFSYEWYINDEYVDNSSTLEYTFPSSEWWCCEDAYIRLRVTDIYTDEFEDSNVIHARVESCHKNFNFNVSPNPVKDILTITIDDSKIINSNSAFSSSLIKSPQFKGESDDYYSIILIDNFGKVLLQLKTREKQVSIDVSKFKPGNYLLKISSTNDEVTKNIIIS